LSLVTKQDTGDHYHQAISSN